MFTTPIVLPLLLNLTDDVERENQENTKRIKTKQSRHREYRLLRLPVINVGKDAVNDC